MEIWYCNILDEENNYYSLEYLKKMYCDIPTNEVEDYCISLCDEFKCNYNGIIRNQYVKLNEKECLFICEADEEEKTNQEEKEKEINQIQILERQISRDKNEIIKSIQLNHDIANYSEYMRRKHDDIIRCQAIIDYIKTKKVRKYGDL